MQFALACGGWACIIISWELIIYEDPSLRFYVFQVHLELRSEHIQRLSVSFKAAGYTSALLSTAERHRATAHDTLPSNWRGETGAQMEIKKRKDN